MPVVEKCRARDFPFVSELIFTKQKKTLADPFLTMSKSRIRGMFEEKKIFVFREDAIISAAWIFEPCPSPCRIYDAGKNLIYESLEIKTKIRNVVYSDNINFIEFVFAIKKSQGNSIWEVSMKDRHLWEELVEQKRQSQYIFVTSKVTAFADRVGLFVPKYDFPLVMLTEGPERDVPRKGMPAPLIDTATVHEIGHYGDFSGEVLRIKQKIKNLSWKNHWSNYNEGESWSAVSLRGFGGKIDFLADPFEMPKKWRKENPEKMSWTISDTPMMKMFPEVKRILDILPGDKQRVRFMKLSPGGGTLGRHTDKMIKSFVMKIGGVARLHIPITTNPKVKFRVWGIYGFPFICKMKKGSLYFLNIWAPHEATNKGKRERVHLVIDVVIDSEFYKVLERKIFLHDIIRGFYGGVIT